MNCKACGNSLSDQDPVIPVHMFYSYVVGGQTKEGVGPAQYIHLSCEEAAKAT